VFDDELYPPPLNSVLQPSCSFITQKLKLLYFTKDLSLPTRGERLIDFHVPLLPLVLIMFFILSV
ncbi:MAG: hypothetical protein V3R57_00805, partial [Candidatus Bathyarchaeia archaeon]